MSSILIELSLFEHSVCDCWCECDYVDTELYIQYNSKTKTVRERKGLRTAKEYSVMNFNLVLDIFFARLGYTSFADREKAGYKFSFKVIEAEGSNPIKLIKRKGLISDLSQVDFSDFLKNIFFNMSESFTYVSRIYSEGCKTPHIKVVPTKRKHVIRQDPKTGNWVSSEYNIVFDRETRKAIGNNPVDGKYGEIEPLTEEQIEICDKNHWMF